MHKVLFLSGTILLVAVALGCEEICAQIDPSLAGLCGGPGPDGDTDTDVDPDQCEVQLDVCLDVCGPGIWYPGPLDGSTVPMTDEDPATGVVTEPWPMTCEDECWDKYYFCIDSPPPPPPGECESDDQCPDGFFCEVMCYDTCQAIGCPEPGCFGQCVPFEPPPPPPPGECNSDWDCGPGQVCEFLCWDCAYPAECEAGYDCDQDDFCESGCSGFCMDVQPPPPPPVECKYDWDCGPEQVCEFVCWDCGYPGDDVPDYDCESGCTGYCVEVPPPPGPDCTTDAECPDGFLCEVFCWDYDCDQTLPDCPEGGCFGECVPGDDPLPWPA